MRACYSSESECLTVGGRRIYGVITVSATGSLTALAHPSWARAAWFLDTAKRIAELHIVLKSELQEISSAAVDFCLDICKGAREHLCIRSAMMLRGSIICGEREGINVGDEQQERATQEGKSGKRTRSRLTRFGMDSEQKKG